jgi:hypothetical protein
MKKMIFCTMMLAFWGAVIAAPNPGKGKVFYKDQTIDAPEYSITIVGAVAVDDYTKFKIKIRNKSTDILVLKPQQIVFVINGKEYTASQEKTMTIAPSDDASRVVDLKGPNFMVDKYTLKINSVFRAKPLGAALTVPNFKLPAASNDFTIGNFKCTLKRQVRKTDVTDIAFDCSYSGSKLGLVDPSKASLRMPNGREYANMHNTKRPLLLEGGTNDDFVLVWKKIPVSDGDMQFVDMQILFGEMFKEVALEKLADQTVNMEADKGK